MNIKYKCDGCGQGLITDSKYAGAKVKCPKCKKLLFVPGGKPATGNNSPAGTPSNGPESMPLSKAAKILRIPVNADLKQARQAYRQLAKLYNPDTGIKRSAKNFIEIVAALEVFEETIGESSRALIPISGYGWNQFLTELRVVTQQSLEVAEEQRRIVFPRVKKLIKRQVMLYGSRAELQKRAENDANAIAQREVRAYIQRVMRRIPTVEEKFRSWVGQIQYTAYEGDLPHGLFDYLKRPVGILLSAVVFAILFSGTLIAIHSLPTNTFENKTLATLSIVLVSGLIAALSTYGSYGLFMLSAREKKRYLLSVMTSEVGMEDLQVGAVPISYALSSQERAGLFGGGAGLASLGLLGLEPITGAIAAAAAVWGWATGKTLGKMKREATESLIQTFKMRFKDFYDSFTHEIIKISNQKLEDMRLIYLQKLGPDRLVQESTLGIKAPESKNMLSPPASGEGVKHQAG